MVGDITIKHAFRSFRNLTNNSMINYRVFIPAYSQKIKAKSEQDAIETFNESIDTLQDINDETLNVKIEIIKAPAKRW